MGGQAQASGPDLAGEGVAVGDLVDGGKLVGHVGDEAVLVVRRGDQFHAVGATCTHYGGPLVDGVVVGDPGCLEIRCPWHHARFDLRSGAATGAPALSPIACYDVERRDDRVYVLGKRPEAAPPHVAGTQPASVVIVGAGAAGNACAEMLRREGYRGRLVLVGAEATGPVDRPNLSKDYLAGNAPEEWIPLRPPGFYAAMGIELLVGTEATRIDVDRREVHLADGRVRGYEALVLATGAEPIRLGIPGADGAHVHLLRTLADSRAIIADAANAKRAVVIGASFIGLEAAASLRARSLEVHVVAPEARPLERILGPAVGDFVRQLHEEHGVVFHLGRKPASIEPGKVTLDDGTTLGADLVVMGVGVRPRTALAEAAGIRCENGVLVDEQLRTSAPGVWAVGDIARHVDARTGERVRIEHWVVAERQGQAAARAILGSGARYASVPFFWSAHYDVTLALVGNTAGHDAVDVAGSLAGRDARVTYRKQGRIVALATLFRDVDSLEAEAAMERGDDATLEAISRR